MGKFISTELDMNYTDEEIDKFMFISRAHWDNQESAKNHHKEPRPLFAQFTNWLPQFNFKSNFIVGSVETGLGKWMLVVTVISVDAYPFLAFPDLTCHLEDTVIGVFWLHCAAW